MKRGKRDRKKGGKRKKEDNEEGRLNKLRRKKTIR